MSEAIGGIPNFEGGKVVLSTGDVQVLIVDLSSNHIDIHVEDKKFIKRIIAMRDELIPKMPGDGSGGDEDKPPQIGGALSTARSVANTLSDKGITITFSYKGHRIATIGADAHSVLLQRITKTRKIALNSVFSAIKMLV
jgi:hypothetical protein